MSTDSASIELLRGRFHAQLASAATPADLKSLHDEFLSRKAGAITGLMKTLGTLPPEARREFGQLVNTLKTEIETALDQRRSALESTRRPAGAIDVTLPGRKLPMGRVHPLMRVRRQVEDIFAHMGYEILEGPEVEDDFHNFAALNFPPDHPARDTQDTFFVDVDKLLLRTHTSNVQIRTMEGHKPPIKVLSPGRVYRRDEITMRRSPMFHQVEGLLIDKGIHMGHLRATLEHMIRRLFGEDSKMRFRPSFFPFTEPSAEVDMSCLFCKGAGCGTCSQTGWMEILGCGMVHPQVLRNVGIDPEQWSGFAFGLGIDRVAMLKFDVPNIRTLFENDLRVLNQF